MDSVNLCTSMQYLHYSPRQQHYSHYYPKAEKVLPSFLVIIILWISVGGSHQTLRRRRIWPHVFISERAGLIKYMRISDQNVTTLWNGEGGCLWMIQEPTTGNLFAACRSFVGLFTGNGTLMNIAGSPLVKGFQDGSFKNSLFNRPVGMAFLDSKSLLVTDFENDRLRVLNLRTNTTFSICSGTEGYDDVNWLPHIQCRKSTIPFMWEITNA